MTTESVCLENRSVSLHEHGRNYGIDLLRILSMIMIVTLHVLRQGGILEVLDTGTVKYFTAWTLESLSLCAVNIYALISGFVGVSSGSARFYKILSMWIQVEFYCIISTVILYCTKTDTFDFAELINRLAPVSTNRYWYFTAYFIMFFFTPVFNKLLQSLHERQMKYLFGIIFIFASLWPTVWQADIMKLNNGYSFLWLSLLYLLGGCVRKLGLYKRVNMRLMVVLYFVLTLSGMAFMAGAEEWNWPVAENNLLSYYAFNILLASVCLLLAGAKTKIKRQAPVNIIRALAPLTFGVYIIHTSEYVWDHVLKVAFGFFPSMSAPVLVLAVIATALAIYLACSLIEWLRMTLFKWLKVDPFTEWIEQKARNVLDQKIFKKESGI